MGGLHIEDEQAAFEDMQTVKQRSERVEEMVKRAEYMVEQCTTLTDEQEDAIRVELNRSDLDEHRAYKIIERIKELMPPSSDPRQQLKTMKV